MPKKKVKKKKKAARATTTIPTKAKTVAARAVHKGGRPKKTGLSDADKLVLDEYLKDFNATAAYQRVFPNKKKTTAEVLSSRLMHRPAARKYLQERIKERRESLGAEAEESMRECRRIALADVGEAFNDDGSLKSIKDIPEDLRRAIAGFEVLEVWEGTGKDREFVGELKKVKFWSKNKEIENLFKHHGLFEKDNNQGGTKTVVIVNFENIDDSKPSIL